MLRHCILDYAESEHYVIKIGIFLRFKGIDVW